MNVDFLPERIRMQRAQRARMIRQGYLLAITVAALAVLGYLNQQRVARAQGHLVMLDDQAVNMKRQLETLDGLQQQLAGLMIKERIDSQLGSRINATDVLRELARILPESMALTNLDLEATGILVEVERVGGGISSARAIPAEPKPRGKVVKRVKVVLTGLSPNNVDVANFIADVSASPLFEDVNMGYTKNVIFRGRSAKQFQASFYVVR